MKARNNGSLISSESFQSSGSLQMLPPILPSISPHRSSSWTKRVVACSRVVQTLLFQVYLQQTPRFLKTVSSQCTHVHRLSSSLTSGSTSHSGLIFQSPKALAIRSRWMSSFIAASSIRSIASFTLTSFIDCVTVLLDSFINHTTLLLPSLHTSSLYSLLSHESVDLLRVTPSRLLAVCVTQPSIERPLFVHLSGELLESSTLDALQRKLPHAHFFNVYGGFIC